MKQTLTLVIIFFIGIWASLCAQVPMKLPYEIVGGKMRIKVFVNLQPKYFIFDTGGRTTITKELQQELNLPHTDSILVMDVTSQTKIYPIHNIASLQFENQEINITNVPTLVLEEGSKVFSYFDAVGIIGNDLISHFVMEIDSREKMIYLLPDSHKVTASLRNMVKFETDDNQRNMPIFKIGLNAGETMRILFDTGASPFLSVSESEYTNLKDSEAISSVKEGISRSAMGIAGVMQTIKETRLALPLVSVGTQKFQNVTASVSNVPISLLGTPLLQYGKVIIDYPHSRFYFQPFDKEAITFTAKSWNIGLSVKDGGLYIVSLMGDKQNEANIGDRVLTIDGENVPTLDFADTLINGLMLLKDKNKSELTIENQGQIKTISMEKE